MTKHPLTNKKLFKKFWDYTVDSDLMGQVFYTPDGMRAAYDRGRDHQLKQVMKWLDKNISNYTDDDYQSSSFGDCEPLDKLEGDLKKAMRPTKAPAGNGREGALNALDRLYEENDEGLRRLAQEDNS